MWDLGDNVNVTFRALMELWGRGGSSCRGRATGGGGVVDETAKVGGDELIIGLFLRLAKRL